MRLDAVLAKLAPDMRELLAVRKAHGKSTLECARSAALQGRSLETPPALRHEAPFQQANLLWGALFADSVGLGATGYAEGSYKLPEGAKYLGGLMMDVLDGAARPAHVFFVPTFDGAVRGGQLLVVVANAPLGAMEAELFDEDRSCSEFECAWLGDEAATAAWETRTGAVAQEVRAGPGNAGFAAFPKWMLAGPYHVVRPGVLPLLRLRLPTTQLEEDAMALSRPPGFYLAENLNELAHHLSERNPDFVEDEVRAENETMFGAPALSAAVTRDDVLDLNTMFAAGVRACTVFQARGTAQGPSDDAPADALAQALVRLRESDPDAQVPVRRTLLVPLARMVLLFLHDTAPGYYGLDPPTPLSVEEWGRLQLHQTFDVFDRHAATELRALTHLPPGGGPATIAVESELKRAMWRTGRACTHRRVGAPNGVLDTMHCIVDELFSASDAALLKRALRASRVGADARAANGVSNGPESLPFDESPSPRLTTHFNVVGRMLRSEQLIAYSDVGANGLVAYTGIAGGGVPQHFALDLDDVCRLALCPWAAHVVWNGTLVTRLVVLGVPQLHPALSEAARSAGALGEATPAAMAPAAMAAASAPAPGASSATTSAEVKNAVQVAKVASDAAVSAAAVATTVKKDLEALLKRLRADADSLKATVATATAAAAAAAAAAPGATTTPSRSEAVEAIHLAKRRLLTYDRAAFGRA